MKILYRSNVIVRSLVLWLAFMIVQWCVFGVGLLTHPEAWMDVPAVARATGWDVFFYIISRNLILMIFIVIGNLFARFGPLTPGLVILAYQAVSIGWTAGTNGFAEPFSSVAAANAAFLRIGLWETTSYVLTCAVTLTKSLNIADTFPPQTWAETRMLKALDFNAMEIIVTTLGVFCLVGAALVEAF
jgi:hypothetical protein